MLKVHQIINSYYSSNTFILYSDESKGCLLIDCGDIEPIHNFIETNELKIEGVFLTHTHYDHIYGLNDLLQAYPKVNVYTSQHGAEALKNSRLNLSHYSGFDYTFNGDNVIAINGNICINQFNCEIIPVPGHDPSCLAFSIDNFLFTGDSFLPAYKLVMNFPKSNKQEAKLSEERLKKIAHDMTVCPGHGNITNI